MGVVEPQTIKLSLPPGGLKLERGGVLPEVTVTYERCGKLNPEGDNIIYICHALTGDAHVAGSRPGESEPSGWWQVMVGPGLGIDTNHYHIICANILGGCQGTTGPSSINPETGKPYGSKFPKITVRDMVDVQYLLLQQLGVKSLAAVVGGSFGGMQVLEWTRRYPDFIRRSIVIASAASLNSQALAFDIIGRQAIVLDPNWQGGDYYDSPNGPPNVGLASARKLAHVTYLSQKLMDVKFGREIRREWLEAGAEFHQRALERFRTYFQVESYLDYQGKKFVGRFDANSYLHITRAMDEYDATEGYDSLAEALAAVKSRMLLVSLSGDWLFTPEQSEDIVTALLKNGQRVSYCHLDAPSGHDAFLTNVEDLSCAVRAFLPWVGTPVRRVEASPTITEHKIIAEFVPEKARVLDLGCSDGRLLTYLEKKCAVKGTGVELKIEHVVQAIDNGHDTLLEDIDDGLRIIPDNAYDFAVLSETLQLTLRPRDALNQILRIAPEAVVSFPNFAYLPIRARLLLRGRMPKAKALPYEWYDTPNIHLFTLKDFLNLCRSDNIKVKHIRCLSQSKVGRLISALGHRNLGADRVIAHISR